MDVPLTGAVTLSWTSAFIFLVLFLLFVVLIRDMHLVDELAEEDEELDDLPFIVF